MEIKSTMTTCPNGHHYDTAKHSVCPVCGAQGGAFPPAGKPLDNSGVFSPTELPGGASGSFSSTISLSGNAGFRDTLPPDGWQNSGNPAAFGNETIIGGDHIDGEQYDPVVGWLVCIEGAVRGNDYRIHAGYNYIGRETGDIRILGDQQISRQNHAMIAFDSSELTYFVGPSAGRNLIKVNGKTILNAVEIHNYDVISIGATKLIFVALCSEKFNWESRAQNNG